LALTLTTLDTRFDDPDGETIDRVLASLDGGRHVLATLAHSELTYLQASGSAQAGLTLDYQDGSLDRHYRSRATRLALGQVTDVFHKYACDDEAWRQGIEWEHVPHRPQQTPWFSTWVGYLLVLVIVIVLIWLWRGP
jgi:hypothetical protein